ncbi:MAG TPA: hypothetical protein VGM39_04805 [Kofleriaceae bacterium]|jgi:hypothetical protein
MLHQAPTPSTPQNDFVTLTDEELARVDGGFIQMLGALLNLAGPLINQFTHKSGHSQRGQDQNQQQGQSDQNQSGDQNQAPQGDGSQSQSSGGGFNLGNLLGGLLGGGK